jgi:phosphopantothenoylcysteine decarboxylase/phosphopantothenate--cysteine ligase
MKSRPDTPGQTDLAGYEVLVGVCGGVAAYKVCAVVSSLVQRGASVTVAMTRSARRFVGPVTFQALTGRRVLTSLWHGRDVADVQHITLTDAADLMLIAPATANIIGKMASGIADDLVSTLVIGAASPVALWGNPIVQRNVAALSEQGYKFIGPGEGWLACGRVGPGRMAEAEEIVSVVLPMLEANPAKRMAKVE